MFSSPLLLVVLHRPRWRAPSIDEPVPGKYDRNQLKREEALDWFAREAQDWINYGPTASDGQGFVYVFSEVVCKHGCCKIYKVGFTTRKDPKIRMRELEKKNGKVYEFEASVHVRYCKNSEIIFRRHLRALGMGLPPRTLESGQLQAGGTEWFRGAHVPKYFANMSERIQELDKHGRRSRNLDKRPPGTSTLKDDGESDYGISCPRQRELDLRGGHSLP